MRIQLEDQRRGTINLEASANLEKVMENVDISSTRGNEEQQLRQVGLNTLNQTRTQEANQQLPTNGIVGNQRRHHDTILSLDTEGIISLSQRAEQQLPTNVF